MPRPRKTEPSLSEAEIERRFRSIPPAVTGQELIRRGTREWNNREIARKKAGCWSMSFGSIAESNRTNGNSAMYPPLPKGASPLRPQAE